jgi:hypothetical protein
VHHSQHVPSFAGKRQRVADWGQAVLLPLLINLKLRGCKTAKQFKLARLHNRSLNYQGGQPIEHEALLSWSRQRVCCRLGSLGRTCRGKADITRFKVQVNHIRHGENGDKRSLESDYRGDSPRARSSSTGGSLAKLSLIPRSAPSRAPNTIAFLASGSCRVPTYMSRWGNFGFSRAAVL